ncbi:MAG: serine/threonine-protein kinase [Pseudomonadota bacterium]
MLKPLARGGMGELDLAVTGGRGMEKLCVIKRVLPHLLVADNVQRFREEATVVVRLSHGNLVGVLDAGREEGEFYLAMDFVEGKDLLATWNQCATRRVAFPIEIAAYVIKELARGLAYAHTFRDLHLVHRDISPANVLLSYSGEVKLTDFGLATSKLKEQMTAPGIIYGKLAYLAPEQARGLPLDGRTDLYAAGILLWEMLTGQQLFPSKLPGNGSASGGRHSTLEALERVKNPTVRAPSSVTARVPRDLDDIVMRALSVEPDSRYQTGEDLRADLASFLARHAPATDAATLASFMKLLFQDQIDRDLNDRDALLAEASALLSGPLGVGVGAARTAGDGGAPTPAQRAAANGRTSDSDPDATTGAMERGPRDTPRPGAAAGRRLRDRRAGQIGGQLDVPIDLPPAGRRDETIAFGDAGAGAGAPGPDQDQRVGSTIGGRYFLRRLCGEGAMGRVYEGHHVEIGRRVAVKILHSTFRNTPDVVERFRREARAASRIGHPNIVDVTDSGTTSDGAFYFVMEYLDGVDLEHLIGREGPMAVERALLISAQVCRALVAAHEAGIIHRDLKPANVMLVRNRDEEDFVKVLDFGISKQSELDIDPRGKNVGLTRPDAAVGTPIYMAPEQVAGHPADGRTDVYAVGELLFEMLTGAAACGGSDVIAVFNKKANEDPPPVRSLRPDVPVAIEVMLAQAMSRRPADRHETMAALKDEVMRCLTHVEEAPAPPGIPRRTDLGTMATGRVWRPPSRALWIAGAGIVAGLGLAAVVVLWRTDIRNPGGRPAARTESAALATRAGQDDHASPRLPSPGKSSAETPPPSASPTPIPDETAAVASVAARSAAETRPGRLPKPAPPTLGIRKPPVLRPAPRSATTPAVTTAPATASASASASTKTAKGATTTAEHGDPAEILRRGRAAFAKGNFPDAVRLGRAVLPTSEALGGHLLLGDAFYRMERFADAAAEYDAALKMAPANPQARKGRELAIRRAESR